MSADTFGNSEPLLNMFFDEDFVPQAYVDILLSSFQTDQLDELKTNCSGLLSKLDYYNGNISKELESTIQRLQKPAELIVYSASEEQQGTTKLEYYLDTLANSVNLLEIDVKDIDKQLLELNSRYDDSSGITETLSKLTAAKKHLETVKRSFDLLKTIMEISIQEDQDKLQNISTEDFKLALATLQETVFVTLNQPLSDSSDLLKKIDAFIELKHILKGLKKFYGPYTEFSQAIQKEKDRYLNSKDSLDEL
ncbi:unnamed protein product [Kluyveromyces dobzhanskii CBS 2104]|uniref:WGS project CCBQ000000000 data, contig 00107 n=1 Tax=Kluyveromyces dobzhanskii CBS 2104 TaxID=1427455 RepID=A0A0A8L1B0_9SACH|nr:unnamed protein product [Kluyveromyces dobzhanskii CBS 2104]